MLTTTTSGCVVVVTFEKILFFTLSFILHKKTHLSLPTEHTDDPRFRTNCVRLSTDLLEYRKSPRELLVPSILCCVRTLTNPLLLCLILDKVRIRNFWGHDRMQNLDTGRATYLWERCPTYLHRMTCAYPQSQLFEYRIRNNTIMVVNQVNDLLGGVKVDF